MGKLIKTIGFFLKLKCTEICKSEFMAIILLVSSVVGCVLLINWAGGWYEFIFTCIGWIFISIMFSIIGGAATYTFLTWIRDNWRKAKRLVEIAEKGVGDEANN